MLAADDAERLGLPETCDPYPGHHPCHDDDRRDGELRDAGEPAPEVAAPGDPASRANEQATGRELEVADGFLATEPETTGRTRRQVPPAAMPSRNVISQ